MEAACRCSLTTPSHHHLRHSLSDPPPLNTKPFSLPAAPKLICSPLFAVKSPKGFGPPAAPRKKNSSRKKRDSGGSSKEVNQNGLNNEEEEEEEEVEDAIPEVVTNRMMKRMGLSVAAPLMVGILFFPFFYYLKKVVKLDVPTWIPFIVSLFFLGTALVGVSYGIVSSSWDPLREGSLLGWNEAQKNWPVFWESLWGNNKSSKK